MAISEQSCAPDERQGEGAEPPSRHTVTVTTLGPVLGLAAALVVSWSVWALVVRPRVPQQAPGGETVVAVLAHVIFWVVPSSLYLTRYWGRRWPEPLGLGFPLGLAQLRRTLWLTAAAALLLVMGTAAQRGVSTAELLLDLSGTMELRLTAPIFEELVFRGLVLSELINWARDSSTSRVALRLRFWSAMLIAACVFTLVHWPWWIASSGLEATLARSLPLLVTGLVLGFVFAHTRSIWGCVALHWLNNELSGLG